jgi:hypothetical protein
MVEVAASLKKNTCHNTWRFYFERVWNYERTWAALEKLIGVTTELQVRLVEWGEKWATKSRILHAASLHNQPTITQWKNFEVRTCYESLWTSFYLMDLPNASFNLFRAKLMLNTGASFTIQKSDGWVVGRWWSLLRFEARNRAIHEWERWSFILVMRSGFGNGTACDISYHLKLPKYQI